MDTASLVVILITSMLWIPIYCTILIYHLRKYQSQRNNVVYLLRYSNITVIQSILFICKLIFGVFAMLSTLVIFGKFTFEDKMVHAVNAYLAAFFLYCFLWKFWLLRYNIMLNNIVMNGKWRSIINQNDSINDTFYAKYRKTAGNIKWTMIICLIMAIILTTFFVIPNVFYPEFYTHSDDINPYFLEFYAGWDYIVPFILLVMIYVFTPKFEDNFYITKEMKYIFICLCVQYITYYGELLIMGSLYPLDKSVENIVFGIKFQLVAGAQFTAMLISLYWVNARCEKIIKSHRYEIHNIPSGLDFHLKEQVLVQIQPKELIKDISAPDHESQQTIQQTIQQILSSSIMYIEFMKHLSKEYSVECLLSFTEFLQFREYMKEQIDCNEIEDEMDIKLPLDIPQSYIVQHTEWSDKQKAYKLYKKYIEIGSKLEINISFEQRSIYSYLLGDYQTFIDKSTTNKELFDLFLPCIQEMFFLLTHSKTRFVQSAVYQKLLM